MGSDQLNATQLHPTRVPEQGLIVQGWKIEEVGLYEPRSLVQRFIAYMTGLENGENNERKSGGLIPGSFLMLVLRLIT